MLDNHYTTPRSRTPIIDLDQVVFTPLLTSELDYCPREDPALVGREVCLWTTRRAKEAEQRNGR